VLDLAGNSITHGLPVEERNWSLASAPKRQTGQPPGWTCRNCDCLNPPGAAFCLDCGASRPARPREMTVDAQAELVELQHQEERRIAQLSYRAFMARPRTRREFEIYRRAHGYRKGWVWHAERQQAEMFGAVR
jgi:hypothetical protein